MKILFIASDNNSSSGAFLSMVALNQLLNEKFGVETFVVLPREGNGAVLLEERNIPYEIVHSYDWVIPLEEKGKFKTNLKRVVKEFVNKKASRRIAKIVTREKADLIHINTTYAYVGSLAAKIAKIPYIWHLREFVEEDQGRTLWNRKKGNKLIASADKVIAISTSVYEKYKDIIPAEKLITILNGIDTDRFYRPEKKIFQDPDKIYLVYGGGYARRKGIYEFASAVELLVENGITNVEIWYIGEPNEKYMKHLEKVGLTPYIKYLGYQKDVSQWYEKADIAFSCSVAEAFGRKTVEAMLCGTLMIAADTGGTLDIIFDEYTGIRYKQGNPIDLMQKIVYALNNKEICKELADKGRTFAYENLSAYINAEKIFEVYKELLNK